MGDIKSDNQNNKFLADPMDRVGSAIADMMVVLMPLIVLLMAPFKSLIQQALIVDDSTSLYFIYAGMMLTIVSALFVYHVASQCLLGRTLGQLCFGLKVVQLWGFQKPTVFQYALRSALWMISMGLLFVPMLSVFTDLKRRSFIDRASDTLVVHFGDRGVGAPILFERSLAQACGIVILLLFGFMSSSYVYRVFSVYSSKEFNVERLESSGDLCESVGSMKDHWKKKDLSVGRLESAMSLYAAGMIDEDCLSRETEFLFRFGDQSALNYLASSFVYSENPEVSNKYLAQVCKEDNESEACAMSRVIDAWSSDKTNEAKDQFAKIDIENNIYAAIWASRFYFSEMNFSKSLDILKNIPQGGMIADFLSGQSIKNQWALGEKSKARAGLTAIHPYLSASSALELDTWICREESFETCHSSVEPKSCQRVKDAIMKKPGVLQDEQVALAYVESQSCQDKPLENIEQINEMVLGSYKSLKIKDEDLKDSIAYKYLNSESLSASVKSYLRRKLVERITKNKDLEEFYESWKASPESMDKYKTAHILFEAMNNKKMQRRALEIGLTLKAKNFLKPSIGQKLVVLSYKLKGVEEARKIYTSSIAKNKASTRAPASVEYKDIVLKIKAAE